MSASGPSSDSFDDLNVDPFDGDDEAIDLSAGGELTDDVESDGDAAEHRRIAVRRCVERRLDVYLQQRLKGMSRSKLKQLILAGGVTVNDQHPKPSTIVHAEDVIDIILPPRAVRSIEPEPIELDVIYEDDDMIVINKHAGIIVHPARSNPSGTLVNALAWRFQQQCEADGVEFQKRQTRGFKKRDRGEVPGLSSVRAAEFRPGIVHRLDRNTTGVILVAKNDEAHWAIARQFEDRTTIKAYLALVHGNFDQFSGVIDQPLGKHPTIREAHAVRHDSASKHAVTLYRVREQYRGYSLVELELKTGRTHQIRVHLSYMGYPIVGDLTYGGEAVGEPELIDPPIAAGSRRMLTYARTREEGRRAADRVAARNDILIAYPALNATFLQLLHPSTHERVTFTAALHEPFRSLVQRLRRQRLPDAPTTSDGCYVDLAHACPE